MANTIQPFVFVYCDGERYNTNVLFVYCDGRRYNTNGFFCYCDGKRYTTNAVFFVFAMAHAITPMLFFYCDSKRYKTMACFVIAMANDIQPMPFCLLRWQTKYNQCCFFAFGMEMICWLTSGCRWHRVSVTTGGGQNTFAPTQMETLKNPLLDGLLPCMTAMSFPHTNYPTLLKWSEYWVFI